jgi:hypothetical protein
VDADGVYLNVVPINSGFMGPGDFPNEILISVPKKDLVSPMPTVGNKTVFVTDFESGNARFQPAVDFGPSDGQAALLGAPRIFPAIDKLNRTNVLNAAGPGPASLSATANITVPLLVSPPQTAVQPDGSSDLETSIGTGTGFSSSVLEVGDSLWAVNNVKIDNRNGLRWFEIDESTNVLLQTGTISDPLHDYFYPSIAANSFGDVLIGFNRSGLDEFVSSYGVVGDTLGGITTFGDPILLQAGQANYFQDFGVGRNRWGDYSATTLDPNDPLRFWTIQEWVSSPNIWSTQITELIFTPIPEPSTLLLFGTGILGLMGYTWRRRRRAA